MMKTSLRNLLFFKSIFNGRVDDQAIASAFAVESSASFSTSAAGTQPAAAGTPAASSTAAAIRKHSAKPAEPRYPSLLKGSAFVFPYADDCSGKVTCSSSSDGSAGDAVAVEGTFSRLLTEEGLSAAIGTATAAAPSSSSTKLAFFHNGTLYCVPAVVEGGKGKGPAVVSFPSVTVVTSTDDDKANINSNAATTTETTMEKVTREANVYIASCVSAVLYDLATTAARHATAHAAYDQHLCHKQTHQLQLATIETYRYALDALAASVEAEDSPLLAVFARKALRESVGAANDLMGAYVREHGKKVLAAPQPHPSSPATLSVDYGSLLRAEALLATLSLSGGATDADVGLFALGDVLGKASTKAAPSSLFSKNALRLSPTHSHAKTIVAALEDELATFVSATAKTVSPKHKAQVQLATEVASEMLATVAVVHRFSAALAADVDGEGKVQGSIAPAFCALSNSRRAAAVRELAALQAASKTIKPCDLDDVATHPSQ